LVSLPLSLEECSRILSPLPLCRALRKLAHSRRQLLDSDICHHSTRSRFLLHYTARDEVALLDRGTGGVPEVRNAIDNYDETSPLYGFLHYRRRKVILRYMPEGLSRLILGTTQASVRRGARICH
jgi:hypothetical protein